jgi:hypothetical protein
MFLDHTQRRSTVGRTPLDEWSACRRDFYLTTHDTHNRQISMPPVGFESTISVGERPATAHLLRSWVRLPPGSWIFVCCEFRVLSGRGLCDELITRLEESYGLCCVVVCDLETSRIGAPYIYDISNLRVKYWYSIVQSIHTFWFSLISWIKVGYRVNVNSAVRKYKDTLKDTAHKRTTKSGRPKGLYIYKLGLIPSTQRRAKGEGKTPVLNLFLYDVSVAAGGHVVPESCPSTFGFVFQLFASNAFYQCINLKCSVVNVCTARFNITKMCIWLTIYVCISNN